MKKNYLLLLTFLICISLGAKANEELGKLPYFEDFESCKESGALLPQGWKWEYS